MTYRKLIGMYGEVGHVWVGGVAPKPHLRLMYTPTPTHPGSPSHWAVKLVSGGNYYNRARMQTYFHDTAWGACMSAARLWF